MIKHLHHSQSILAVPVVVGIDEGVTYKDAYWRIRYHGSGAATLSVTLPTFKVLCKNGKTIHYYCKNPTNRTINRWATKILFEMATEKSRIRALEKLDKLVKPLEGNKRFLAWVEEQEKEMGDSFYDTMTEPVIYQWVAKVIEWKKNRKKVSW